MRPAGPPGRAPGPQAPYLIMLSFSLHRCSSLRTLCFSPLITCRGTTTVKLTDGGPHPGLRCHGLPHPAVPGLGRGALPTPWECLHSLPPGRVPAELYPPIRSPASLLDSKQGGRGAGARCSLPQRVPPLGGGTGHRIASGTRHGRPKPSGPGQPHPQHVPPGSLTGVQGRPLRLSASCSLLTRRFGR